MRTGPWSIFLIGVPNIAPSVGSNFAKSLKSVVRTADISGAARTWKLHMACPNTTCSETVPFCAGTDESE